MEWKRHHAIETLFSRGKKRHFTYQPKTKDVKVKCVRGFGAAGHLAVFVMAFKPETPPRRQADVSISSVEKRTEDFRSLLSGLLF